MGFNSGFKELTNPQRP